MAKYAAVLSRAAASSNADQESVRNNPDEIFFNFNFAWKKYRIIDSGSSRMDWVAVHFDVVR